MEFLLLKDDLNVVSRKLQFKLTDIHILQKDIIDIHLKLRPRTLRKTLESKHYNKFKSKVYQNYHEYLDVNLCDFLSTLKDQGDDFYLSFFNKNWKGPFCHFKINEFLNHRGIYCFVSGDEIKYLGKSVQIMKKRINEGYGKIHPKNPFLDGQSTNCRINKLINSSNDLKFGIMPLDKYSANEINWIEKEILLNYNFPWNVQKR